MNHFWIKLSVFLNIAILFTLNPSNALAGFGISPPYFYNDEMGVGDKYSQTIFVMRSADSIQDEGQGIDIKVDNPVWSSWLKFPKSNYFSFAKDEYRVAMPVTIEVPIDAAPGSYEGKIYLRMGQRRTNNASNGIMEGAIVDARITVIEKSDFDIKDQSIYKRLKGRIVLKAGDRGKAYYVHPRDKKIYYLGNSTKAFGVVRSQAIGMTDGNIEKIPSSLTSKILSNEKATPKIDLGFADKYKGRFLLQTQKKGEAWFVSPADGKRYFLGRPEDISVVVKKVGLGISNADFGNLIKTRSFE